MAQRISGCVCCPTPGDCTCPIPRVPDVAPGTFYCPTCVCLDFLSWTDSTGSSTCTPQHPNTCHTESFPDLSTLGSFDGHSHGAFGTGDCPAVLNWFCVDNIFYLRIDVTTPDNPLGISIGRTIPITIISCDPFWVDTGLQTETHGGTTVSYRVTIGPGPC